MMDEIDLAILKELTRNAQMRFSLVAKKVGVSPRTVQKRYEKMLQKQLVFASTIVIDSSKIGFDGKVFLAVVLAPGHEKTSAINAIGQVPNVFLVTEIIGDYDLLATALVKGFNGLIDVVENIKKIAGIEEVEATFALDTDYPVSQEFNNLFSEAKVNLDH